MQTQIKLDYSDIKFKDDGRLKLLIIVGTRPEIIRLSAVINKCRKYFDTVLAHTGQFLVDLGKLGRQGHLRQERTHLQGR